MNDRHKHDQHEPKESVGAIFATPEEARQALGALHKAHFVKSWIAVTSLATDDHGDQKLTAESASANPFDIGSKGVVEALIAHGVDSDTAAAIESEIEPGEALVTVETEKRDPAEAVAILERYGGYTELSATRGAGSTGTPAAMAYESSADPGDEVALDLPVWEEEIVYVRGRR